jgi:hypothetical protein
MHFKRLLKNNIITFSILFIVSGCSVTPPVDQTDATPLVSESGIDMRGRKLYLVKVESSSPMKSRDAGLKIAEDYCRKQGLKAFHNNEKINSILRDVRRNRYTAEVYFNCL